MGVLKTRDQQGWMFLRSEVLRGALNEIKWSVVCHLQFCYAEISKPNKSVWPLFCKMSRRNLQIREASCLSVCGELLLGVCVGSSWLKKKAHLRLRFRLTEFTVQDLGLGCESAAAVTTRIKD